VADRVAHEIKNPLNGLALNLEVVRSRSEREGVERSALSPYATAAASELEQTIPLVEALLSLARPSAFPVDLRTALRPLATLYGAIARAAGGSLRIRNDSEQMFVAGDGTTVRVLLAELLDASVGEKREVNGTVIRRGEHVALSLNTPLARPIGRDVQRLGDACGMQLTHDHGETLLMFPALAHSGVDSRS
jgi:nitrogen fixation/metabolism regulation signal transduction histidine kinase